MPGPSPQTSEDKDGVYMPSSNGSEDASEETVRGDDERNATRPRHIPTMPPDAHTGSPQTPAEGATTVSPRRPSKRTAAAVANLGIAKTLQEQDVETESESSDDEVPTGGASDRVAPRRHKLLATPGGTLPHAWLRVMEQEYGSRHRLDLELQKERAKLAREVAADLDRTQPTPGIYHYSSGKWDLHKSTPVDLVMMSSPMIGKSLTYTLPTNSVRDASKGCGCCKGVIVNGAKIRCDKCGGEGVKRTIFEDKHVGASYHRSANYLVIDEVDMTLKTFCLMMSNIDLHIAPCILCNRTRRPGDPSQDFDTLYTCASCPAAYHKACYRDYLAQYQPTNIAADPLSVCASCTNAADCAAAGCDWCSKHGSADTKVDMDAAWSEYQRELPPIAPRPMSRTDGRPVATTGEAAESSRAAERRGRSPGGAARRTAARDRKRIAVDRGAGALQQPDHAAGSPQPADSLAERSPFVVPARSTSPGPMNPPFAATPPAIPAVPPAAIAPPANPAMPPAAVPPPATAAQEAEQLTMLVKMVYGILDAVEVEVQAIRPDMHEHILGRVLEAANTELQLRNLNASSVVVQQHRRLWLDVYAQQIRHYHNGLQRPDQLTEARKGAACRMLGMIFDILELQQI